MDGSQNEDLKDPVPAITGTYRNPDSHSNLEVRNDYI